MKRRLLALWLIMSVIIQGCITSAESTFESLNQVSSTPLLDIPTSTVSRIVIPSTTHTPAASPSPNITDTPQPTPSPIETARPACFTMLLALPDIKTYPGKIVFLTEGDYIYSKDSHLLASLFYLNTRQSMPMRPGKVNNIQVSPDGLTYAVHEKTDDLIKFFSASGKLIRTLSPGEYQYGLDHWLNDEQIALNILTDVGMPFYKYPVDQVIYNPYTSGQKRMISDLYPDIDQADARRIWEGFSTTKYDPLLKKVVYPGKIAKDYLGKSGWGYVLWDLEKQVKLAEIVTSYNRATPKWAPDGSRFVINDSDGDGEFYAVTRDGEVTQLSRLNPKRPPDSAKSGYFSDLYSWSPDGRYLAFWLETFQNSTIQGTLAVLDTETGKVINTCISAGFEDKGAPVLDSKFVPIWSPDGKYLVTEANRREDGSYQSVLIDLEGKFGAELEENKFAVGWLADSGD